MAREQHEPLILNAATKGASESTPIVDDFPMAVLIHELVSTTQSVENNHLIKGSRIDLSDSLARNQNSTPLT